MKKAIYLLVTFFVVGLIVFVLFKNKAEIAQKSKLTPITSYPVTVVTATRQNLNQNISQVAVIVANNDIIVSSQMQGLVTSVPVKVGDYVETGTILVQIFNDLAKITSPISGYVNSLSVSVGTMLTPGTVIANIVDTSQFKVDLNIDEIYAFKLKVGDSVTITSDVYPGVTFKGRISSIGVKGDTAHTYPIEIIIPSNNQQYRLKSGMYGTVSFNLPSLNALTIPRTALVGSLKTPQVYLVKQGKAKLQDLVIGPEIGLNLIILQGLETGDQVVFSGQDNLRDGIAVKIITEDQSQPTEIKHNKKHHRS